MKLDPEARARIRDLIMSDGFEQLGWGDGDPALTGGMIADYVRELEGAARPFSGLSHAQIERFAILAEEASEVVQDVMKIFRHGPASTNPVKYQSTMTNAIHLAREIGQLLFIIEKLVDLGDLDENEINLGKHHKKTDIKQYIHYPENV